MSVTPPLSLFLAACILPIFFAGIRAAPLWLAVQALALGWFVLVQHGELSLHSLTAAVEVIAVRAWLAPALLWRSLARHTLGRHDLMPSNLFAWGAAVTVIILAFQFGVGASIEARALTLGAVSLGVSIALLILATNAAAPAQLIALLFMENALVLFESTMPTPWPWPVHGALSAVYLLTVVVGSWLIASDEPPGTTVAEEARDYP